ncbi:DUF3060 domain-containing protein [Alcaligenes sp. SDU_A2]|uniref:DUF3060 domain-containing protein n=1 Tax=Alcaligenes sp. SDU_A2 TaxID=3136634 RepID=UPI00311D3D63
MRTVLLCALLSGMAVGTAQANALELDGINVQRTIPCQGRDINISGNANKLQLTGPCGRVDVAGSEHVITLERANALDIGGIEQKISAASVGGLIVSGSGHRIQSAVQGAPLAAIEIDGEGHALELDLRGPSTLTIAGIGQRVDWSGTEPTISTSGADHRIEQHTGKNKP